jgi:hypothetical protein
MPRIEKRVTPEQKKAWQAFCQERGISESNMLGLVIEKITGDQVGFEFKGLTGPKTGKVTIRLFPDEIDRMTARARSEGFPSRTTWLTNVVLSVLNDDPILTDVEVNTLRASNRELAAIGRNLNQVARAINIDFREGNQISLSAIQALSDRIEQHKATVAELTNKSMNRWVKD